MPYLDILPLQMFHFNSMDFLDTVQEQLASPCLYISTYPFMVNKIISPIHSNVILSGHLRHKFFFLFLRALMPLVFFYLMCACHLSHQAALKDKTCSSVLGTTTHLYTVIMITVLKYIILYHSFVY